MENKLAQKTRLITEGPIVKSLFLIAWPIVFANTLHTAYQLIDTFWVGRLGAPAVAAVSVSFPMLFFLLGFGFGLSIAASVFVAQFAGARRHEMVNHVTAQTILMVVVISLLLSVVGYYTAPSVLRLIGIGPDIFADTIRYLRISYIGLIFSYGFILFQSILRGIGEVRFPLYVIIATVLLNAILDPLFIFGWGPVPGFGVSGAAYATLITQGIAAVVGIGVLFGGRYGIRLKAADFIPDWRFIHEAVKVALPASIEQTTRTLGSIMLTFLATGFGTVSLATLGLGMRIMSFVFIPAFGLGMATTTLVGQNIGAGNILRAEQAARLSGWVGFWSLNVFAVLFYLFAEPLVRLFVPADEALVASGVEFVSIATISFGVIGAQQALLGAFRGAGGTMSAMAISLVTQWILQFPVSYILCMHTPLGVAGIWWGFPIANIIATILTVIWFQYGTWQDLKLMEQGIPPEALHKHTLIDDAASEQEYIN